MTLLPLTPPVFSFNPTGNGFAARKFESDCTCSFEIYNLFINLSLIVLASLKIIINLSLIFFINLSLIVLAPLKFIFFL